jgi:acid phosphatase type 7
LHALILAALGNGAEVLTFVLHPIQGRVEGVSKTVLVVGSMASAMVFACVAALLTATPGAGKPRTVTLVGAGDIAGCNFKADRKTARLLGRIPGTVFTLGDNAYQNGTRKQFRNCYDPTWGKYKKRTRPTAGNHDYHTSGAEPYFDYFGWRAGKPGRGYYSYELGSWHIVALNSNCKELGGCGRRSAQGRWLKSDLDRHDAKCTLAYFHEPLFASGNVLDTHKVRSFWNKLYNHQADVILSGHAHRYERFARITPSGERSSARGIRQFIVGTGGAPDEFQQGPDDPRVQAKKVGAPGVLKLDLGSGFYHWKFVPVAGRNYTDSGRARCH